MKMAMEAGPLDVGGVGLWLELEDGEGIGAAGGEQALGGEADTAFRGRAPLRASPTAVLYTRRAKKVVLLARATVPGAPTDAQKPHARHM